MMVSLILTNVCKHISLTEEEKKLFVSLLESRTVKKKEFLLKPGEICKYTSFVNSGCLKSYTTDRDGGEHILSFAVSDWWIADLYSLISGKPAILNIEAITESNILMLSRENQSILYSQIPKFERFFRLLIENSLVANQQRLINNMTLTAEERYEIFIRKYPAVLEYVPLHNVASYLGITPEFLSKIRARLAKRGSF